MYLIYNILLCIAVIIFSPVILAAFLIKPKFRAGFWQKIGFYNLKLKPRKTLWFHAVSVGEVNAVEALIKKTRQELPYCNIVLSTVTKTGNEVAKKKLSEFVDEIVYFPYDFFLSVLSAVNAIAPNQVIIAETEIWPNFSFVLKMKKIPLMIVNGRISPSSYKGYKKFSFFFKNILKNYTTILMQTDSDKKRIIDIGADPLKVETMGNLKFNFSNVLSKEEITNLQTELKLSGKKLFIAGSTHKGEDEIVLDVFGRLKEEVPELKLLLVPRHPERYDQVQDLIVQFGKPFGFRSRNDNFEEKDIILLDTMGELGKMYAVCDLAFIGGSFVKTGGHNPLEATIYNKPVISGKTVFNFKDIYQILVSEGAAYIVTKEDEFFQTALRLLSDKVEYIKAAESCKNVFSKNNGALDYALDRIKGILDLEGK